MNNDQSSEVGYVISARDFLVSVDGLPTAKINDLVESNHLRGWVNSLSSDRVEVLMVDEGRFTPGQMFKKLPQVLGLNASSSLLGRSINPLGVPVDGKGPLPKAKNSQFLELEQEVVGICGREFIRQQFLTGMTLIDTLIPLGKGQRELVIGDAHSGKTAFLIDLIVNQKSSRTICVVGLIGKTATATKAFIETLRTNKILNYTVVVASFSNDPAPLIFLTPKAAFCVAQYFQKQGQDVLLILDDMGTHAKIYREISLLGNKPPGRQSYPGDIFYQQAHLMEQAGKFSSSAGGGSITALPVLELNLNDFTSLIPTNLMAMTDGHLLFSSSLYAQNLRPAIDLAISVSRVGRQTQSYLINALSLRIRAVLSEAQELETISRFSSELPIDTQQILQKKELILELLKHDPLTFVPLPVQVILLGLIFTSFLTGKDAHFIEYYKKKLVGSFLNTPELKSLTDSIPSFKTDLELIKTLEGVGPILARLCPNLNK